MSDCWLETKMGKAGTVRIASAARRPQRAPYSLVTVREITETATRKTSLAPDGRPAMRAAAYAADQLPSPSAAAIEIRSARSALVAARSGNPQATRAAPGSAMATRASRIMAAAIQQYRAAVRT